MNTLLNRVTELRERQRGFEREVRKHADFCNFVVTLLETHGVNTVGDLPMEAQHAIAERSVRLTPESELELEKRELERLNQELLAQLPPDFWGMPQ